MLTGAEREFINAVCMPAAGGIWCERMMHDLPCVVMRAVDDRIRSVQDDLVDNPPAENPARIASARKIPADDPSGKRACRGDETRQRIRGI